MKIASLSKMPLEIERMIIRNLSPGAALALQAVNEYYRKAASLKNLNQKRVQAFLKRFISSPRYYKAYPCFSCLEIKDRAAFANKQMLMFEKSSTKHNKHSRPSCLMCWIETKRMLPGRVVRVGDKSRRVYCDACLDVCLDFCTNCHRCHGCVKKGVVSTLRKTPWSKEHGILECSRHQWVEIRPVPDYSNITVSSHYYSCVSRRFSTFAVYSYHTQESLAIALHPFGIAYGLFFCVARCLILIYQDLCFQPTSSFFASRPTTSSKSNTTQIINSKELILLMGLISEHIHSVFWGRDIRSYLIHSKAYRSIVAANISHAKRLSKRQI